MSGMSRLVDRLERAGLVARVACREDHRGAYAQFTGDGLARLGAGKATVEEVVHESLLALYDDREIAALAGYWRRYFDREGSNADGGKEQCHGK